MPQTAGRGKGARYDNGMDCVNAPLLRWHLMRHIKATRARPCRKHANCCAERKNFGTVRESVGCFRFDPSAAHTALKGRGIPCARFTAVGTRLPSWSKQ
jgi:hypothetical protein